MTYAPSQWRRRVEARLATLQQELARLDGASMERGTLQYRIELLERELRLLDEDDQQWGTQWIDAETGAAADLS